MDKHNPAPLDDERTPSYVVPRWDIPRRQRLRLDRRVRAVRRWLITGGVIGTVAFSALAGSGTKVASGAGSSTQTATQASATQGTAPGFFTGQSSPALGPANATTTSQTHTRTQTS